MLIGLAMAAGLLPGIVAAAPAPPAPTSLDAFDDGRDGSVDAPALDTAAARTAATTAPGSLPIGEDIAAQLASVPGGGAWHQAYADAMASQEEAQANVDRLRARVESDSIAEIVGGTAELNGLDVAPAAVTAAPAPAGTPPGIAAPVGRLAAAVGKAEELSRGAIAPDAQLPTLDELVTAVVEAQREQAQQDHDAETAEPSSGPAAARLRDLAHRVDAAIDMRAVASGAATVATALDEALPALRAYAAANAPTGVAVVGCDVVDQPPAVCIGSEADNTYDTDYALLIDLGGADLYRNAAGVGNPVYGNGIAASLNIDLGEGSDLYDATPTEQAVLFHGSAATGGIGMLIDDGGDDSYVIQPGEERDDIPGVSGYAAGQAFALTGGVGVLADLGGDDTYRITAQPRGTTAARVQGGYQVHGQAAAVHGGAAALVDAGAGDDTYLLDGSSTYWVAPDGVVHAGGHAAVNGQGSAVLAAAILADGGGADSITARADSPLPPGHTGAVALGADRATLVSAGGYSQSFDGEGGAVVITGQGPTRMEVVATTGVPRRNLILSGIANASGGLAAVSDSGGDDTYIVRGRAEVTAATSAPDGCRCAEVVAADVHADGIGFGSFWGAVVLVDDRGEGNDRYELDAASVAASLSPEGAAGEAGPPARSGQAIVRGQAAAQYGRASLRDGGGDDVYQARATSTADPGNAGAETSQGPSGYLVQGSGAVLGFAALLDEAGSDAYRVVATSRAHGPHVGGDARFSAAHGGSLYGSSLFVDRGPESDEFSIAAPYPAETCVGTRGDGMWANCGGYYTAAPLALRYYTPRYGVGVGLNDPLGVNEPTPEPSSDPAPPEEFTDTFYFHRGMHGPVPFHSVSSATFDKTPPSLDRPIVANASPSEQVRPAWGAVEVVDGTVTALKIDVWQKNLLGEVRRGVVDYEVRVTVNYSDSEGNQVLAGDYRLSPFTVEASPGADVQRVTHTFTTTDDGEPLAIAAGGIGTDRSFGIFVHARHRLDGEGAVLLYDSVDYPSGFSVVSR